MIYSYPNLAVYWSNTTNAKFNAFHVTPYLSKILEQGMLQPPSQTGGFVLGEHSRDAGASTIRGCLLSFFDNFQNAMNGCYMLALFALIEKKLIAFEDFSLIVRAEIEAQGGLNQNRFQGMSIDTFLEILNPSHMFGDASTIFELLSRSLDRFTNPSILGKQWVQDLPNTVEGVLKSIGVIEVHFDRKFISDPSLLESGYDSEVYGFTLPKGDFGQSLDQIQGLYGDMHDLSHIFDEAGQTATKVARWINTVCMQDSIKLKTQDVESELEDIFGSIDEFQGFDHPTYGKCLQFEDEITFVSKVTIAPNEIALWNPEEHEWRIPVPYGIPVSIKNVIAYAGEISTALGASTRDIKRATYVRGTEVRGRRKNPQTRQNPMTTIRDLGEFMNLYTSDGRTDEEFFEIAALNYRASLLTPKKFLERYPKKAGYQYLKAGDFLWIGPKGRMLRVYAKDIIPVEGNIFDFEKLKGLAVAPKFVNEEIPLFVGYADPWVMCENMLKEHIDYEVDFYTPSEEDLNEIFFQIRDGNHRTIGALLSGAPYAYVQIYDTTFLEYKEWIEKGRPKDDYSSVLFQYLDDNLI